MRNNQFKYISIAVVLVLLLVSRLFFVGKHSTRNYQRSEEGNYNTETRSDNAPSEKTSFASDLNRNAMHLIYSRHARCRMDCRHIDEQEVRQILATGTVNVRKIETDERGKTYPLEGVANGHHLRIVFANKGTDAVEVVTCIDLDTEWQCDCH